MRLAVLVLFLVAFAAAAAPQTRRPRPSGPPQFSPDQDREAIESLHQRDIAASMAFDVDKLVGLWDDNIVAMPPNSAPLAGLEANRAYLVKNRETMANVDILSYEEQWDEVRVVGDYAYEYGSIHSRLRPQDAKEETAVAFNVMRILKREPDGDWKIYRAIWNDRKPAAPPTSPAKPAEKPQD